MKKFFYVITIITLFFITGCGNLKDNNEPTAVSFNLNNAPKYVTNYTLTIDIYSGDNLILKDYSISSYSFEIKVSDVSLGQQTFTIKMYSAYNGDTPVLAYTGYAQGDIKPGINILSVDFTAPVISGTTSSPTTPEQGGAISITTYITDDVGASGIIYYRLNADTTSSFSAIAMTKTSDTMYSGQIPGSVTTSATSLQYYVKATDGFHSKYCYDNSSTDSEAIAQASPHSITITKASSGGSSTISFVKESPDTFAGYSSGFRPIFEITFPQNSVDTTTKTVYLNYRIGTSGSFTSVTMDGFPMSTSISYNYLINSSLTSSASTIQYYITALDSGASVTYYYGNAGAVTTEPTTTPLSASNIEM